MIEKSRSTMDKEARDQVYQDLQKYIVDQAIWVPLWIDQYTAAFDKSIQGALWHPDAYAVYFDAWVKS
jgi:peptide/nickel transport system substrate-binding protein